MVVSPPNSRVESLVALVPKIFATMVSVSRLQGKVVYVAASFHQGFPRIFLRMMSFASRGITCCFRSDSQMPLMLRRRKKIHEIAKKRCISIGRFLNDYGTLNDGFYELS